MADYYVLDALGDGDCLFNSFAIDFAYHFLNGHEQWNELLTHKHLKPNYVALANKLLPHLNQVRQSNNQSLLPEYPENINAESLHERLRQIFLSFKRPGAKADLDLDWVLLQKTISPHLRALMVDACLDRDKWVINLNNRGVKLTNTLKQSFDHALESNVLNFVSQKTATGYFQDHPVFVEKLKELFKDYEHIDFSGEDNADILYAQHMEPKAKSFKKWFFEQGGLEAFYDHPDYGLRHPKNTTDSFSLEMLSTLFGMVINYKRVNPKNPKHVKYQNGVAVLNDNSPEWRHVYRFYMPEQYQEFQPAENALAFHLQSAPGHYLAALPESDTSKAVAETYLNLRRNYSFKKSNYTPPGAQYAPSTYPLISVGIGLLMLTAYVVALPFMVLTSPFALSILGISTLMIAAGSWVLSNTEPMNEPEPAHIPIPAAKPSDSENEAELDDVLKPAPAPITNLADLHKGQKNKDRVQDSEQPNLEPTKQPNLEQNAGYRT